MNKMSWNSDGGDQDLPGRRLSGRPLSEAYEFEWRCRGGFGAIRAAHRTDRWHYEDDGLNQLTLSFFLRLHLHPFSRERERSAATNLIETGFLL